MPASIFISHVYEDSRSKDTIRDWAARGLLGPGIVITGETADVRQEGEAAVRAHLHPKLRGAAAVVVLVGNNSHNHAWLDYEVGHALSERKVVLAVRLPGTTGAPPNAIRTAALVAFEPGALARALRS